MEAKMTFIDYCMVLGLRPNAEHKEIAEAYKSLAKRWHPDKNIGIDTTLQMQLILEAYNFLKDEENRKHFLEEYKRKNIDDIEIEPIEPIEIVVCYYCKEALADSNCSHQETFYRASTKKVASHSPDAYDTKQIKIPRCEKCYHIHQRKLSVIGFWLLGITVGFTIWMMWFFSPIYGALIGLFLTIILFSIDGWLIAKEAGIKREKKVNEFEAVVVLRSEEWGKTYKN